MPKTPFQGELLPLISQNFASYQRVQGMQWIASVSFRELAIGSCSSHADVQKVANIRAQDTFIREDAGTCTYPEAVTAIGKLSNSTLHSN